MTKWPTALPTSVSLEKHGLCMALSRGRSDEERFPESVGTPVIDVCVMHDGQAICEGSFYLHGDGWGSFEEIWVRPGRRRTGIATAVYDAVAGLGLRVVPSKEMDEDGAMFWEARQASGGAFEAAP